ncbi:MAG TPA: CBS domain-containing protein [Candidatus Polarisedimenticolaceae bacterium]|nr:CBS domain-containing protein [Candidatus Polarisedimenticolaceae bacterium]
MTYVASDIMSKDVFCVRKDTDLRDLGKLFLSRNITGAPVLDLEGDLCGVISQTDLLYYQLSRDDELIVPSDFYQRARVDGRPIAQGFQIEDVNTATVEEVMTPVVHAVSGTTPVGEIARLMTRRHIHRVIVREGKKVAGIISALDLLRVIDSPNGSKPAAKRRPAAKRAKPKARKSAKARPRRHRAA